MIMVKPALLKTVSLLIPHDPSVFLQDVFGFTEPIAHLILGTVIGIYAPIALYKICQRSRLRYIFRLA